MKKVILSEKDLPEFLNYCVSYGYDPTCVNKAHSFQGNPIKFMFRLKKSLEKIDFIILKRKCPSFDIYSI